MASTTDNTNGIPNLVNIPKGYAPLNSAGMQLANLAAWHAQRIGQMGYLAVPPENQATTLPLGNPANPASTQRRAWLDEPPGSIPFDEQASLPLTGTVQPEVPVLTQVVPQGFDGVIKWISNNVTGTFAPGALLWSIKVNGRPYRNFAMITQQKGTIAQGREISPLRIFAGDILTYAVTEVLGGSTGQTVVSLTGFYYPSKGVS